MAAGLPTGRVTFLFSDIERSTRLLQLVGAAEYARLQELHRVLLRSAFDAHSGVEVGTAGDSFFVAFSSASDAVAAALAAQLALADPEWPGANRIRVRIGLDTGEAIPIGRDYAALAVNQAARISAVAHGAQVLMSADTYELARANQPNDVEFRSLGRHWLKDMAAPVELFQLCHPSLPLAFPPPRSLEVVAHNLPVQVSTFVGRDVELAALTGALGGARLVSVCGPGGSGKTRLAYQAAANTVEDYPDGVWVAELAAVSDEASVAVELLQRVGLRDEPGLSPTETLVEHFRSREALVVLDNCEHVIASATTLTQALLTGCTAVRVLATTREAMRVPGEAVYQLGGLGLPSPAMPDDAEALMNADAIRLFVARATSVRPGFGLDDGNAADIATICARIDGLPLAIELAASRIRSMSPNQIVARLDHSLDLLTKGSRTSDPRQATLRATIDWSHQLLSPHEQVLFRRLAVFAGGWTLPAAEQVAGGDSLGQILDGLDALVDKSLVTVGQNQTRDITYRYLETIHAYADERLAAAGETEMLADRHAAWCVDLAGEASRCALGSTEEAACFDRLDSVHPNLLAGLDHLRRQGSPAELKLAARLSQFWLSRHWRVGSVQLAAALLGSSWPSKARCHVAGTVGVIAMRLGDYARAERYFDEAIAMARDLGDRGLEAGYLGSSGHVPYALGNYPEARARFDEALTIARDLGDRRTEGYWLGNSANVASTVGDYPQARKGHEDALAIARDLSDRASEGICLGNLGQVAYRLGDYTQAQACYEEALAVACELGDPRHEGLWIGSLGQVAISLGDFTQARACYEEALAVARKLGDPRHETLWIGSLGQIATSLGDYAQARKHLGEAVVIAAKLAALDVSDNIAESVAGFLAAVGRHREAVELLACADRTRRTFGLARVQVGQESPDTIIAKARSVAGAEAVEHWLAAGSHRSNQLLSMAHKGLSAIKLETS